MMHIQGGKKLLTANIMLVVALITGNTNSCFAAGLTGASGGMLPEYTDSIVIEEYVYTNADFAICHASTLLELEDGGLLCAFFAGTDEGEDDVEIRLCRKEPGKEWTAPVSVADGIQPDNRYPTWNPVLFQPKGGDIMLFYKVGPHPSSWWGEMKTSSDGGKTWSEAQRLPDSAGIIGPVKNKPVQLADGTIISGSSLEDSPGWRTHVERSTDSARTWTHIGPLSNPAEFRVIQPTILTHSDGRLQMLMRSGDNTADNKIVQTWSSDSGLTWTPMSNTTLPNNSAGIDAVTLEDGRHLLVYNHSTRATPNMGHNGRGVLNVAVSTDGENWEAALVLEHNGKTGTRLSYPAVIQTSDGLVHVTYTWYRKRIKHVVFDPNMLVTYPIIDGAWPVEQIPLITSIHCAFPGAEGYGSETPGGRGGKVIQVTNLNDSGPGSLREAINASGPRIVVFRISGTIALKSDLVINNPNITIAGQTAPGAGICIKDYKLRISADDVILRYLRIRRGNESGEDDDALSVENAENVIIDHCSISWGCDETVNTWHGVKNSTMQWCIISEALHHKNHGFAASLGGEYTSYHHLLFANCPGQNPGIAGNSEHQTINMDLRNNVLFNWGHRTVDGLPNSVNLVHNYYKPGPNSTLMLFAILQDDNIPEIPTPSWNIYGNVWEGNEAISKDNSLGVAIEGNAQLVDKQFPYAPVKVYFAEKAYQMVLDDVGAVLPKRDSVDMRIIEEVKTGIPTYGKGVVMDPADVGGWPELSSDPAPVDTDKDGIPDDWELANDLDPNDPEDRNIYSPEGYTMLEVYLDSLVKDLTVGVDDFTVSDPTGFMLDQNYPNPFNPSTTISLQLPRKIYTTLKVYDVMGREVMVLADGIRTAGIHQLRFDGNGLPGGIYFARLHAGSYSKTIKIMLTK
jgi:predicted neuraminidase